MKNENLYTMKQPDLGKKISEIRKQKGLTQEELVEQCNINVRTIQRIEAGEVTPRSYTLKNILSVLGVEIQEFSSNETIKINEKELQKIKKGWFSGIFVTVISVLMIVGEIYLNTKDVNGFAFRLVTSILLLISLFFFLNSYRLIGVVSDNKILKTAACFYWFLTLICCFVNTFLIDNGSGDNLSRIDILPLLLLIVIPFGLSEVFLGIGIVKLKNTFGSFSQLVGILKIVNGSFLLSMFLSVVGVFLVIPILILELINLNEIIKKLRPMNHS